MKRSVCMPPNVAVRANRATVTCGHAIVRPFDADVKPDCETDPAVNTDINNKQHRKSEMNPQGKSGF